MKKVRNLKILVMVIIIAISTICFTNSVKAESDVKEDNCIEIYTTETNLKSGQEFDLIVKSSKDLNMGSIRADIKFDTGKFEFVEGKDGCAKVEVGNNWSSIIVGINSSKLSAISNDKINAGEEICKIKIKAKNNITLKKDSLKLENISIVNGNYEKQAIKEVKLAVKENNYVMYIYILIGLVILIVIVIILIIVLIKRRNKEKTNKNKEEINENKEKINESKE